MDGPCQHRAVAALRTARGWTRDDLAVESGVEVETLAAIEAGTRPCDPVTADALIRAFVAGDDDATWLAILCAQSYAFQWKVISFLMEATPAGGSVITDDVGDLERPCKRIHAVVSPPRSLVRHANRLLGQCGICGRAAWGYRHPNPDRAGVVLFRCRHHRGPRFAQENPKAAPGGGVYR